MKNILRKLHIGGNHDDQVDAGRTIEGGSVGSQRESPLGGTVSSSAASGSPGAFNFSSLEPKPSGLATFFNAVKDSVGRVAQSPHSFSSHNSGEKSGNPIVNAIGQLRQRLDSSGGVSVASGEEHDSPAAASKRETSSPPGSFERGMSSPPGSIKRASVLRNDDQKDVHEKDVQPAVQTEEEYQVQMAMALSVSGTYQHTVAAGAVEKAQIEVAKRISLGLSPTVVNSESEAVSYRYWASSIVGYDEVVPDGFYDIFGVNIGSYLSERMPLLVDLQKMPITDTSKIEVVLVNREVDPDLVTLQSKAAELAACAELNDQSLWRTYIAQKIALLVSEHMGGPVGSETDMLARWKKTSWEAKSTIQNVVVTLGSLNIGLTRHRALLFKVLADSVGIPCQLIKGRHYPGVEEEGAVNIIKVDDNREYIIDLMGAPGALLPSDRTTISTADVVSDNVSVAELSPNGPKTGSSSSFVSSTQSSPSSSMRSRHLESGEHNKERQKETSEAAREKIGSVKLEGRHGSEPTELDGLNLKPARSGGPARHAHWRSPSWTEGIGFNSAWQNKDVPQLVFDAARDNPQLAQKLHDVVLESGVISPSELMSTDISPKQFQVQVLEEKKMADDRRMPQERKTTVPTNAPRKKSSGGPGRPPHSTFKPTYLVPEEGSKSKERLQRLDSVEGLGDRRPLEIPGGHIPNPAGDTLSPATNAPTPADNTPTPAGNKPSPAGNTPVPAGNTFTPVGNMPTSTGSTQSAAQVSPMMVVPVLPIRYLEKPVGYSQSGLMRQFPVAAAATAAATAAVVASTMVAAAANSEGGGDGNMDVPIAAAAATATAAVVAATSAVTGIRVDSDGSSPAGSGTQRTIGENTEWPTDHMERNGSGLRYDERRSETDGSASAHSHGAGSNSGDGLDGEVSVEEERNSDNIGGDMQKMYNAVLADVAEWEIPWEDIEIGERIGLGSYGEVYRGDWHGSEVAVKKFLDQDLSGDALEEFRSEVRIMRRLRHPNVVLFMGAITRAPHLSIVTEFLPRGSLYRLIHRPNNQLDDRRRLRMALDVAKGMNYLHSGNPVIVHRDLKSPNLLVDKNWVVKVCDFGLSRMKHNTFLSSKSTAGTPEWMAPEMLRNEPSNEKCDVYSFGVILWELATLQQPWSGMNPMQVVGAVGFQHRRLDIPPEMDPGLAWIIRECWHDNPSARPSFSQLMKALRPLQRPLATAQPSEPNRKGQASQGTTIRSLQPPPYEI